MTFNKSTSPSLTNIIIINNNKYLQNWYKNEKTKKLKNSKNDIKTIDNKCYLLYHIIVLHLYHQLSIKNLVLLSVCWVCAKCDHDEKYQKFTCYYLLILLYLNIPIPTNKESKHHNKYIYNNVYHSVVQQYIQTNSQWIIGSVAQFDRAYVCSFQCCAHFIMKTINYWRRINDFNFTIHRHYRL